MRLKKVLMSTVIMLICTVFSYAKVGMVEISVEITEINTTKANELGIKWTDTITAGEIANEVSGRIPEALPEVPSLIESGKWSRYSTLGAELKLLHENGAAQVLSKPKILTKSGTSAKVIVGGEVPIVATGVSGGTIEWKEYGIKAEITPKILNDGTIDLKLITEVSRLDWTRQVNGNPSLVKREAKSFVQVKSEETIALAGLLETTKEDYVTGIPLLSNIPVLGVLFSHKETIESKTNVLIFVTPKIIE
ncbi:hypothetical protein ACFL58_04390 [Elusimicrobiota bacterium]